MMPKKFLLNDLDVVTGQIYGICIGNSVFVNSFNVGDI